jgi:N-succinyldiaminopimelate aminotransferase
LFALAQTVIDPTRPGATVVCPNPFYQIYEGAALLAGAQVAFVNSDPGSTGLGNFAADWASVSDAVWARTQLLYVCSPGNPTGAVMPLAEWQRLFELSDRHGFVIASDECYSEIYFRDEPPLGSLQAAAQLGRSDFQRLVAFTSLSKRSNVPGMRSGFVAGDAQILKKYLLYRTYQGCAMSPPIHAASIAAWSDETHVAENRRLYREKFDAAMQILGKIPGVIMPDAAFYLWIDTGGDDTVFTRKLYEQFNVKVLPGSYLAREARGVNPGRHFVRVALVAATTECAEACQRIADFIDRN